MPTREEEYWAGKKKSKGKALCPFCGKPYVYPMKAKRLVFFTKTVAWSCANESCRMYRKPFPSPSYGSGGR